MPLTDDLGRLVAALALASSITSCGGGDGSDLTLASVAPETGSARGGDTVSLEGSGFGTSPIVRFGGKEAKVTSVSDTHLQVVVPREIAGAVDVEVEAGSNHARLAKGFTYVAIPLGFVDVAWSRLPAMAVDGGGAVIADVDGDGDQDILQAARGEGIWVYLNDGEGTFAEARTIAIDGDPTDAHGLVARDLDGDGNLDLFVATTGQKPSRLLLGDGKLGFASAKMTALPPVFGTDQQAVAADLDGDGDLDIVTVGSAPKSDGAPGVTILLNLGLGVFSDVTEVRLAGGSFNASGVAVGDVDGDGDQDLFFAADKEPCRLYLGDGHGAFQRAAPDAIPYDPAPGAGIPALGDLDGDGSLDVYLPSAGRDRALFNDGTGHFLDLTDLLLGPEAAGGKSASLVDLDLDGHLDVVVVNGPGRVRLYHNDGTARLFDYTGQVAGNVAQLSNAAVAIGDLDGDGDDDLFVSRADQSRAALFLSWAPLAADDKDADGFPDAVDSCPDAPNPDQANVDSLPFRCASATSCLAETGCELRTFASSAYLVCKAATASWAEASAACTARGGALVTVSNAEENAFLLASGVADAWIGYTDAAVEGTFVWASGESSFKSWGMAQPDDAGGNEDCASFLADGTWNDAPCDGKHGYVCEDLRARKPDPGDACDSCPTAYEPGSMPVAIDGGVCGGGGGGAGGGAP
jgi:lectin-like protein/VCBS repeat protein/IPT/TIG domain-containing protein